MTNRDSRSLRHTAGTWISNIGMLIICAGILMPVLHMQTPVYKWVFTAGAVLTLIGRFITPSIPGASLRVRRLARMETWAALMFVISAGCMFYRGLGPTDWLAFTLAGGVLQAYASIMLPRAMRREQEENKSQKKS